MFRAISVVLCSLFLATGSMAEPPQPTKLNFRVHKPGGPDLVPMMKSYVQFLNKAGLEIADIKVTAVNGYGTPLEGYVAYVPKAIPLGAQAQSVVVSVDCMWGNALHQSYDRLSLIQMMNRTVYAFKILAVNGYGTVCSTEIGYY